MISVLTFAAGKKIQFDVMNALTFASLFIGIAIIERNQNMLCEKSYNATDIALIVCGVIVATILCITAQIVGANGDLLAPNVLRLAAVFIMARVLIRQ